MDISETLRGFESVWKRVEGRDKKPELTLMPKKRKKPVACRFIAGSGEQPSFLGGENEHRA